MQAKREHLEKLKELGQTFRQKNLQSATRNVRQSKPKLDASPARDSARARAMEYIKSVKKPSTRSNPAPPGPNPSVGRVSGLDPARRKGITDQQPKDRVTGGKGMGRQARGHTSVISDDAARHMAWGAGIRDHDAATGNSGGEDIDSLVRTHAFHRERVSDLCSRLLTKVSLKAD